MRDAEKLYPCQRTMFSPLVLISRPAPSPRSSHATRLVTSRSPGELVGWMTLCTHETSAGLFDASAPQCSQSPKGPAAGGGSGVMNDAAVDHAPKAPWYSARTFHVNRLFGVRLSVI